MELVKVLPSKIVQIDGPNALCEDGSVWTYVEIGRQWADVHPPHEPTTQSTDLAEALAVLKRLVEHSIVNYKKSPSEINESIKSFDDAYVLLNKHGVYET